MGAAFARGLLACRALAGAALLALYLLSAAGPPAGAQSQAFANLVGVEVEQLSNAVRVVLNADGLIQVRCDEGHYIDWDMVNQGRWDAAFKAVSVIRLRLRNLRSQTGSFFEVARYPVSHVEVTIPPEGAEGVGLEVSIPLYVPSRLNGIQVQGDSFHGWDPFPAPSFDIRQSDDQRSVIITVLSDRQAQPPEARKSAAEVDRLHRDLTYSLGSRGITLRALNAELRQVVSVLTAAFGVPISVADGLERYVSLYLEEKTLPEVLSALARSYGLALTETGGRYALAEGAPGSSSTFSGSVTEAVHLRSVSAAQAADLFPDFLRRYLKADPGSSSLIVSGPPDLVEKVRADAARIDQAPLQIDVEMVVVETGESFDLVRSLGLEASGPGWAASSDSGTGDVNFSNLGQRPADFAARLQALETRGLLKTRARAHGVALSGGLVEVFAGQERVIQVTSIDDGVPVGHVLRVNVGTMLHCHPRSADGKEITLRLEPELNSLAGLDPATRLPEIVKRQARGTLRVAPGALVYVGGLKSQIETVRTRRIPLLGSLPLIGGLFRSRRTQRDTRDLSIFVTARVLGTGDSPDA